MNWQYTQHDLSWHVCCAKSLTSPLIIVISLTEHAVALGGISYGRIKAGTYLVLDKVGNEPYHLAPRFAPSFQLHAVTPSSAILQGQLYSLISGKNGKDHTGKADTRGRGRPWGNGRRLGGTRIVWGSRQAGGQ